MRIKIFVLSAFFLIPSAFAGDVSQLPGCEDAGSVEKLQQYSEKIKGIKDSAKTITDNLTAARACSTAYARARACRTINGLEQNAYRTLMENIRNAKTEGETLATPVTALKYTACAQKLRTATQLLDQPAAQALMTAKAQCGGCGAAPLNP